MNDSLRTNVFVRFSPETIACVCISLAARQLKVHITTHVCTNTYKCEYCLSITDSSPSKAGLVDCV